MPIQNYDQLRDALEDAADREALRQSRASGEEFVPDALVDRLGGGNPVRVWREYRGLTTTALARRAKVSRAELSAIENGDDAGSVRALCDIADALGVTVDDLLPAVGPRSLRRRSQGAGGVEGGNSRRRRRIRRGRGGPPRGRTGTSRGRNASAAPAPRRAG